MPFGCTECILKIAPNITFGQHFLALKLIVSKKRRMNSLGSPVRLNERSISPWLLTSTFKEKLLKSFRRIKDRNNNLMKQKSVNISEFAKIPLTRKFAKMPHSLSWIDFADYVGIELNDNYTIFLWIIGCIYWTICQVLVSI